jgi:NADPH:quinone reductase-like Zn-dependent oxidoreductase
MTDFGRDGVAAEYVALPAAELMCSMSWVPATSNAKSSTRLSPKPESLSHVEAATLPLPGLSAWQGLFDHGHLAPKHRVFIHGGAGGVGAYAVRLARLHGAHVTATASTARVDTAHQLGAHEVIDHTSSDFTTIDPVDLVLDTAGGERLAQSSSVLKQGGRLVSVAEDPHSNRALPKTPRRCGISSSPVEISSASSPDSLPP